MGALRGRREARSFLGPPTTPPRSLNYRIICTITHKKKLSEFLEFSVTMIMQPHTVTHPHNPSLPVLWLRHISFLAPFKIQECWLVIMEHRQGWARSGRWSLVSDSKISGLEEI